MHLRIGVLFLGVTSFAFADLVLPPGVTWQTVTTPVTTTGEIITGNTAATNAAYWNNNTDDAAGTCENIGCYITGTATINANSPNLTDPVWAGTAAGGAFTDLYFDNGQGASTTMLIEVASLRDRNWLGWYEQGTTITAANRGVTWEVIYVGAANANPLLSTTFTPADDFGLWFLTDFTPGVGTETADLVTALTSGTQNRFTESSRNTGGRSSTQYYTVFAEAGFPNQVPGTVWVGIEDLNNGDFDYNDMVVRLTVVPEPGYYVLLSLGLAGLGWARLRKKTV